MKQILILLSFVCLAFSASAQTTFAERDSLFNDSRFRGRVQQAMLVAASETLANPADSAKFNFAGRIMLNPGSDFFVDQFVAAVLTNPVIDGRSSDNDLQFTVNSQFTKLDLAFRRERGELRQGEQ